MNKKLIAAAVSAAVIPAVGVADSSFYGRVNNAYDVNGIGATSTTDITQIASRFGFRGDTDIGNGLTAHGRYEFRAISDRDEGGTSATGLRARIATAGLSGQFGRIDVGQQWSAYFNTFGTLVSPTYSLGYYLYTATGGNYRTGNTVKYSNSFGALTAQLDLRFDDGEDAEGGGYGLGLSFALSDNVTLAAALHTEDGDPDVDTDDTSLTGMGVKANFGGFSATVGLQTHDDGDSTTDDVTGTFLNLSGSVSDKTSWLVSYSSADNGVAAVAGGGGNPAVPATDDATQLVWGVYHNMGSGMRLYYEATSYSDNKAASDTSRNDGARHLLGMRVDF